MRQRRYIIAIAVVVAISATAFGLFRQLNAKPPEPAQKWPAFTMIYQEWRYGLGLNGAPGTQRIKLIYTDAFHWRTEILSHSAVPDVVGGWAEYNGSTVTSFDPRTGQTTVNNVAMETGIHIPAEWLRPDYISSLLNKPSTAVHDTGVAGEKRLESIEQVSCREPVDLERQSGLGPCTLPQREAKRNIRYRQQDNIPIEITDMLDGIKVQRITVEQLTIQ